MKLLPSPAVVIQQALVLVAAGLIATAIIRALPPAWQRIFSTGGNGS